MQQQQDSNILVVNATENNLQNVTISIPKRKLTVVTGVSGSGKSSLVMGTIAAESRRELNETFPSYVQHYLPRYGRPHVDVIQNLPVTIVLEQKKLSDNIRSTVGTYTDVYTFLRLLYSRVGQPFIGYSDVFSFNHPEGKCPKCDGLGVYKEIQVEKLVDFDKSLNEGPIDYPAFPPNCWRWKRYAYSGLFDLDKKIRDYTPEELDLFLHSPRMKIQNPPDNWPKSALFEGVIPRFRRSIIGSDEGKKHAAYLEKFLSEEQCPECGGTRVNGMVRSCKIDGKSIADIVEMQLDEALEFIRGIDHVLAVDIQTELEKRLGAMLDIGLGYLTLARAAGTLSGGEAQRIKIAKHINGALCDILYVLDEPSAGLHLHDIERLKKSLHKLRQGGNTVIMVEHNPALIQLADHVVDMGPGAGENGGQVVYTGDLLGLLKADTVTSRDLREQTAVRSDPRPPKGWWRLEGVSYHNLRGLDVRIPRGVFTVLCGVAGSGKSSLAEMIRRHISDPVVFISQKSIGISLRSTPATYLNISNAIRKLFAKASGVNQSYFSFNSAGGCPLCRGKGVIVTNMAFMEDIVSPCEKCGGTRYNDETLAYRYRGKNIAEVMGMSVAESLHFFGDESFAHELVLLDKVGLSYCRLNQALSTLSGGELQRLKLASSLGKKGAVYILDEPAGGLHMEDVKTLLTLIDELVEQNNTVIISEHNPSVMKKADWLIELGPGGGSQGGKIIYSGAPNGILENKGSITGPYLGTASNRAQKR